MRLIFINLFLIILASNAVSAQVEEVWVIPPNHQINFSLDSAEIISNPGLYDNDPHSFSYFILPNTNGDIKFYTNGYKVFNSEGTIMPNGNSIKKGDNTFQGLACVHNPQTPNIYHLFISDQGLYHGTIDLNAENGKGDIITYDLIYDNTTDHIIAFPNPCGGVWIIVFDKSSNEYLSFLFENNKINALVRSRVGKSKEIGLGNIGNLRIDNGGEIISSYNLFSFLEFYKFDKYTGNLDELSTIANPTLYRLNYYDGQFSDNGRFYYTIRNSAPYDSIHIVQLDLQSENPNTIEEILIGKIQNPKFSNSGSEYSTSVNTINNKINITHALTRFISTIENPNEKGPNCNFIPKSILFPDTFFSRYNFAKLVEYFDPGPEFQFPSDTVLCPGYSFQLDYNNLPGQIQWNDSFTGPVREISDPGTYIATYTPDQGCPTTDTFIVTQPPEFMSLDTFICFGSTLTYKGITYLAQETYQDTFITHGCETIYEYRIKEYPLPYNENLLPGDTILCTDQSIFIDLSFITEPLTWEDGSTDKQRILDEGGLYFVNLQSIDGCIHTDSLLVEFSDPEVVFLDTTICFGEEIKIGQNIIDTKGIYYDTIYDMDDCPIYYATSVSVDSSGLIADTLFSEINKGESFYWNDIIYSEPGLYSYSGFNENGCPISSFLRLTIETSEPLIIPNIISPNNDGINDAFIVESTANSNISIQSLSIFDRFGSLIHRQAGNLSKDEVYWDNSAQSIVSGVYVYVIEALIKGEIKYFTGSVTVIY